MALNTEYEKLFGEIVLELGVTERGAVESALLMQQQSALEGRERTLAELLVFMGTIDEAQAEEIAKEARSRLDTIPEIEGFKIYKKIGNRGTLALYSAHQESVEREVILKVLHKTRWHDTPAEKRFQTEARLCASLNHKNIVGAIDMGETESCVYFVLQQVHGGTSLAKIMQKHKKIKGHKVAAIGANIAEALYYISQKKLVHGRICEENIIIGDNGQAWLTGFELISEEGVAVEHPGGISPYYPSPEGMETSGFKTDMYALGCMLFHIATGKNPLDILVEKAANGQFKQSPLIAKDYTSKAGNGISAICYTLMQADPELRYEGYPSLIADLNAVAKGEEPQAALPLPGFSLPKLTAWPSSQKGRIILYAASAILALTCSIGLIMANIDNNTQKIPQELLTKNHWKGNYKASERGKEARKLWYKAWAYRKKYLDGDIWALDQEYKAYKELVNKYSDTAYAALAAHRMKMRPPKK